MKVLSVFALTLASASAFVPAAPAFARTTSAIQVTKDEDLELTRNVIRSFHQKQDGISEEEAPVAKEEGKKEPVAAAAEE